MNEIPFYKDFIPSIYAMTNHQRDFYEYWVAEWKKGRKVDINIYSDYVKCYMLTLIETANETNARELISLANAYSENEKVTFFGRIWASDTYVYLEKYREALTVFPELSTYGRSSSSTDKLLSLKLSVGEKVTGRDFLTLFGPKVTSYGRNQLEKIEECLSSLIEAYEIENNTHILKGWQSVSRPSRYYSVFNGSPYGYDYSLKIQIKEYLFSLNKEIEDFIKITTRRAENIVREELNIPFVGKGWRSETELFNRLRDAFPEFEVIHHASPKWLGKQHLDIYFPQLNIAVEYQGLQHDKPVKYFGGEAAFLETQKRDMKKKRVCKKNKVTIIYVRENYDIKQVIEQIFDIVERGHINEPPSFLEF